MFVTGDGRSGVTGHGSFEELVVVRVVFDSIDLFVGVNELGKVLERLDFGSSLIVGQSESIGVFPECLTEFCDGRLGDNQLVLTLVSHNHDIVWDTGRDDRRNEYVRIEDHPHLSSCRAS